MRFTGTRDIGAPRHEVWRALNDPDVLRQCMPGCEKIEGDAERGYDAVASVGVGPIKARVNARITQSEINAPESYKLHVAANAGEAGHGRADVWVELAESNGDTTRLSYRAEALVGGKFAQLGSRLIHAAADMMARQFFSRFAELVAGGKPAEAPRSETAGALAAQIAGLTGKLAKTLFTQVQSLASRAYRKFQDARNATPTAPRSPSQSDSAATPTTAAVGPGQEPAAPRRGTVSITVNGQNHTRDIEHRTLLVELLRNHLGLNGTHVGCDTTQCGACTVIVDGRAVKSCTTLAMAANGGDVLTIEGLADGDELHPVQAAFREHHALQCGFCTPGMVMASVDLIRRTEGQLTEQQVRHGLEGNLCRCTGYQGIVAAVLDAAEQYRSNASGPAANLSEPAANPSGASGGASGTSTGS